MDPFLPAPTFVGAFFWFFADLREAGSSDFRKTRPAVADPKQAFVLTSFNDRRVVQFGRWEPDWREC